MRNKNKKTDVPFERKLFFSLAQSQNLYLYFYEQNIFQQTDSS